MNIDLRQKTFDIENVDWKSLLEWFDGRQRDLPWRLLAKDVVKSNDRNALVYRVWLSEIMCQQTTTETVVPRYLEFIQRWPDLSSFACAPPEQILSAWAGLGYYARARNLIDCAKKVVDDRDGRWPESRQGLLQLPGIGPYTASAISSIVHFEPVLAIDGNIRRIFARLLCSNATGKQLDRQIEDWAHHSLPMDRPGDVNQALMDLGKQVCRPKNPKCSSCPIKAQCLAWKSGVVACYPAAKRKTERKKQQLLAFWLTGKDEGGNLKVFLHRRPGKGLFGGMLTLPTSPLKDLDVNLAEQICHAPLCTDWILPNIPPVHHILTHIEISAYLAIAKSTKHIRDHSIENTSGEWMPLDHIQHAGLPTLFRKIARQAVSFTSNMDESALNL